MSNTGSKAVREFEILNKTVKDAIISPFEKEILALVEKFGNSGQSGGSAPYTAGAISKAVEKLCLQNPICPISGIDEEWCDQSDLGGKHTMFQNNRLSALFKHAKEARAYYIDAIVFQGDSGGAFTGNFELKDGTKIGSAQYIKGFPFTPKTFYVDVIDYRFDKDKKTGKLTPNPDGDWWEHEMKDEDQLKEVFEYYDRK